MGYKIMGEVWEHSDATGNELLLLLALANVANDEDRLCWPSVKYLINETRLPRSSVFKYLASLADRGIVTTMQEEFSPTRRKRITSTLRVIRPVATWPPRKSATTDPGAEGPRTRTVGVRDDGPKGSAATDLEQVEELEGENEELQTRETHARNEKNSGSSPSASTTGLRVRRSPPVEARAADLDEPPNRLIKKPADRTGAPTYTTVPSLVKYFNERVAVSFQTAVSRNDAQLRGNMSLWIKRGVTHAEIKELIDVYCSSPKYRVAGVRDQAIFIRKFDWLLKELPNYREATMTDEQREEAWAERATTETIKDSFDDPHWQRIAKEYGINE